MITGPSSSNSTWRWRRSSWLRVASDSSSSAAPASLAMRAARLTSWPIKSERRRVWRPQWIPIRTQSGWSVSIECRSNRCMSCKHVSRAASALANQSMSPSPSSFTKRASAGRRSSTIISCAVSSSLAASSPATAVYSVKLTMSVKTTAPTTMLVVAALVVVAAAAGVGVGICLALVKLVDCDRTGDARDVDREVVALRTADVEMA